MMVRLADWDGDGRLDVLAVETRSRGRIARSRGLWDASAGAVEATVDVEGSPRIAEVIAQPVAVDWVQMVEAFQAWTFDQQLPLRPSPEL